VATTPDAADGLVEVGEVGEVGAVGAARGGRAGGTITCSTQLYGSANWSTRDH
jgi:hypothetical protein